MPVAHIARQEQEPMRERSRLSVPRGNEAGGETVAQIVNPGAGTRTVGRNVADQLAERLLERACRNGLATVPDKKIITER